MRKLTLSLLCFVLVGCQNTPKSSDQSQFIWQITADDTKIENHLSTDTTITHYDGSSEKVTITQDATSGYVYVLVHLELKKDKAGGSLFSWNKLVLKDSKGTTYPRIDDLFLVSHKFERMTQLDVRLGNVQGWIAFEIPESSSNKVLMLIYKADEGENKIVIDP